MTHKILFFLFLQLLATLNANGQAFGASGYCQDDDNVNCPKWPNSLEDSKRAVFRFSDGNGRGCTGALINQMTSQGSLRYYFLTAKHCVENSNFDVEWRFNFNYQSSDCQNNSVLVDAELPTGGIIWGNRGGFRYEHFSMVRLVEQIGLCDMALLEMLTPPPPHWNVYFAGWSINYGQGLSLPYYAIHHPKGDIKKIAQSHSTFTITNYPCHTVTKIIDGFFRLFGVRVRTEVICSYTESPYYSTPVWSQGVVEEGSSGSPLFNNNQRIIGALSFGAGTCGFSALDQHGRLNTFWNRSRAVRDALNPYNDLFPGALGTNISCYPNTPIIADFYPARDYQPQNRIWVGFADRLTLKRIVLRRNLSIITDEDNNIIRDDNDILDIYPGSDFVLTARNEIELKGDIHIHEGSTLELEIGNCAVASRVGSHMEEEKRPPLPEEAASEKQFQHTASAILMDLVPNPLDQTTTIRYSLPESAYVNLFVADKLGRQVALLVKNQMHTAGTHSVDLTATHLPAGVYMCTLQTNEGKRIHSQTKQLIIIR